MFAVATPLRIEDPVCTAHLLQDSCREDGKVKHRIRGNTAGLPDERVLALTTARVLDPASKLATARGLASETARSTPAESLALGECTEDDLCAAMDWLLKQQRRIESGRAKRHLADSALVLRDPTSTYFEGRACPLARMGYSRDGE
jgi:hypothetical protein